MLIIYIDSFVSNDVTNVTYSPSLSILCVYIEGSREDAEA